MIPFGRASTCITTVPTIGSGTTRVSLYTPSVASADGSAGAIHTEGGALIITQTQEPIHGLNFKSGMLQGWNKVCFWGSMYFEGEFAGTPFGIPVLTVAYCSLVAVSLPGNNIVGGFWPGIWTFGNLGRAGYTGTTDGAWPYVSLIGRLQ